MCVCLLVVLDVILRVEVKAVSEGGRRAFKISPRRPNKMPLYLPLNNTWHALAT